MTDRITEIAQQFDNAELIIIAEELGLSPGSRWRAVRIVGLIEQHIKTKGIPDLVITDESTQAEDLVDDYLYTAGWVDRSGQEESTSPYHLPEETITELNEYMKVAGIKKLPPCFSYAHPDDPSCVDNCRVYRFCAQARVNGLHDCFGIKYDPDDPKCMECLESAFCQNSFRLTTGD